MRKRINESISRDYPKVKKIQRITSKKFFLSEKRITGQKALTGMQFFSILTSFLAGVYLRGHFAENLGEQRLAPIFGF